MRALIALALLLPSLALAQPRTPPPPPSSFYGDIDQIPRSPGQAWTICPTPIQYSATTHLGCKKFPFTSAGASITLTGLNNTNSVNAPCIISGGTLSGCPGIITRFYVLMQGDSLLTFNNSHLDIYTDTDISTPKYSMPMFAIGGYTGPRADTAFPYRGFRTDKVWCQFVPVYDPAGNATGAPRNGAWASCGIRDPITWTSSMKAVLVIPPNACGASCAVWLDLDAEVNSIPDGGWGEWGNKRTWSPNTVGCLDAHYTPPSSTTLSAAITSTSAPSMTVGGTTGFPGSGEPYCDLIDSEIVLVTAGQGTSSQTIIRGYAGTTAATHLINAPVAYNNGMISVPAYETNALSIVSTSSLGRGRVPFASGGFFASGSTTEGSWLATIDGAAQIALGSGWEDTLDEADSGQLTPWATGRTGFFVMPNAQSLSARFMRFYSRFGFTSSLSFAMSNGAAGAGTSTAALMFGLAETTSEK